MDTDICQGITKTSYTNNKCHYRAKYNGYCGRHCSQSEGIELNFCQGLTKSGKNCRKVVKYGEFCNIHKHPEKPDDF